MGGPDVGTRRGTPGSGASVWLVWGAVVVLSLLSSSATSTVVVGGVLAFGWTPPRRTRTTTTTRPWAATLTKESDEPPPPPMKISEMQHELKAQGVDYSDCFDRESLTRKWRDAQRHNKPTKDAPSTTSSFDRARVTAELESLRVSQLRERLKKQFPWIRTVTMVEKRDLVEALVNARQEAASFSASGQISSGFVADLSGEDLDLELGGGTSSSSSSSSWLLLDVYATWCGPCQMMAPQLADAAKEMPRVRMAKMDSDRYPAWASRLQVGGLPTLILFNPQGKEVNRVEGAMMKDGLVAWVQQQQQQQEQQ